MIKNLGWKVAGIFYTLLQALIALLLSMILAKFDKLEAADKDQSDRLNNHETRISHIEGQIGVGSVSEKPNENENHNQSPHIIAGAVGPSPSGNRSE